jgi:ABC-type multidrug transport system ATPase subunit
MVAAVTVAGVRAAVSPDGEIVMAVDQAEFERGKLHLLIGGNGVGKSTFVRTLLGFRPIASGKITWNFASGAKLEISHCSRPRSLSMLYQNVGYVPQGAGDSLWPHRTVREHVSLPLRMKDPQSWLPRVQKQREQQVDGILQRALVTERFWNRKPGIRSALGFGSAMSGGERQRVAYARAISTDPEILVLDELESSLDEASRREFIDGLLRDYLLPDQRLRRTAFAVTHDPAAWTVLSHAGVEPVVWQLKKSLQGQITLQQQPTRLPIRVASPQVIFTAQEFIGADIDKVAFGGVIDAYNEISWRLCKSLLHFLESTVNRSAVIVTVAALDPTLGLHDALPVLLAAAGTAGNVADGSDADLLRQFTPPAEPHTFPEAAQFVPPIGARVPLRNCLISDLILGRLGDALKGYVVDCVRFDTSRGECFSFNGKSLATLDASQKRLQLSKETKAVYIFHVVSNSGMSMAVTFDFLDDVSTLDEWRRFFILRAIDNVCERLSPTMR